MELIFSLIEVAHDNLCLCCLELYFSSIEPPCIRLMTTLGAVKDTGAGTIASSVASFYPLVVQTYRLRSPILMSFSTN